MKNKKIAMVNDQCVACGTCIQICPFSAITVSNGIKASIDLEKCVGCGKCSKTCPATVIDIVNREVGNAN